MLVKKLFLTFHHHRIIEEENFDEEPNYHKHIRNMAIEWSCKAHLEQCLKSTRERMRQFKDEGVIISVDHERVILCHGLMMATRDDFEFMWHRYESAENLERKKFYLKVIGCIESEEILMEFLSRMLTKGSGEWREIIRASYSNHRVGLRVTLEFLKRNYDNVIGL